MSEAKTTRDKDAFLHIDDNKFTTISTTNCSTDRLICKTPLESPGDFSLISDGGNHDAARLGKVAGNVTGVETAVVVRANNGGGLTLGLLQVVLGIILCVCGFFVYNMNFGSGLWCGTLVLTTGLLGTILHYSTSHIHRPLLSTIYLVLSLVTFALSQLTVGLTAITLSRLDLLIDNNDNNANNANNNDANTNGYNNVNNGYNNDNNGYNNRFPNRITDDTLRYGLLVTVMAAAAAECLVAAAAVYLAAKRSCGGGGCCAGCGGRTEGADDEDRGGGEASGSFSPVMLESGKDTLLKSWLGELDSSQHQSVKSGRPPPTPGGTVYMLPPPLQGLPVAYNTCFKRVHGKTTLKPFNNKPMIPPALLTAILPIQVLMSPPTITPHYYRPPSQLPHHYHRHPQQRRHHNHHHSHHRLSPIHNTMSAETTTPPPMSISPQPPTDMSTIYTGLDRTIAEEYIQCCDSRNSQHCSNSIMTTSVNYSQTTDTTNSTS